MALPVDKTILTIGAIAARDQITRQAVAKMVKALVERHNLPVEYDRRGRVSGVDVATYDRLRGQHGQSSQVRHPSPSLASTETNDATIDGARRLKTIEETRLLRMKVAAEAGNTIRRDRHEEAMARLGEEIARCVDLMPFIDRLAAAHSQRDMHSLRVEAKKVTTEIRARISDACAGAAMAAPERDELLATEEQEQD